MVLPVYKTGLRSIWKRLLNWRIRADPIYIQPCASIIGSFSAHIPLYATARPGKLFLQTAALSLQGLLYVTSEKKNITIQKICLLFISFLKTVWTTAQRRIGQSYPHVAKTFLIHSYYWLWLWVYFGPKKYT